MTCMVLNCDNEADGVEFDYWYPDEIRRGRVCKGHNFLVIEEYKHLTLDTPNNT